MQYEPVIGLEIHLQLKTKSKMFSSASNDVWQSEPNSKVSPVEIALPGALPVPNMLAIRWTQQLGFSLNCKVAKTSKFDRKNYFYPDLAKGYQISQYDQPLTFDGCLSIPSSDDVTQTKEIRIRRIHLEEDTGKSSHQKGKTLLDFNKAGVPLAELVTEPDFSSAEECSEFAKMFQEAARTLEISDADMEKGNMRLEANISVRAAGTQGLPDYRVEIKNINSFKFMRDAINYEIKRQSEALDRGERIVQETRGWNKTKGISYVQREKEEAHDYRYFPEPDIPPLEFDDNYIRELTVDLPTMPWAKEQNLVTEGMRADFAKIIAYNQSKYAKYIELNSQKLLKSEELAKIIANTADLANIEDQINAKGNQQKSPNLSEEKLLEIIENSINTNPHAVEDYRKGKETAVKFLLGQVMRNSKGQANPMSAEKMIIEKLAQQG